MIMGAIGHAWFLAVCDYSCACTLTGMVLVYEEEIAIFSARKSTSEVYTVFHSVLQCTNKPKQNKTMLFCEEFHVFLTSEEI